MAESHPNTSETDTAPTLDLYDLETLVNEVHGATLVLQQLYEKLFSGEARDDSIALLRASGAQLRDREPVYCLSPDEDDALAFVVYQLNRKEGPARAIPRGL